MDKKFLALGTICMFTGGFYLGYHTHPTLTLFCHKEQIEDVIRADAPLEQSDGWVEFEKPQVGLFHSWIYPEPKNKQRSNCTAFLYE